MLKIVLECVVYEGKVRGWIRILGLVPNISCPTEKLST